MDSAALTLLDVLDEFEQIPVAVAYQLQGENIHTLPADQAAFSRCQPVYEVLPGWRRPTRDVKRFEELPAGCRDYVDWLERMLGCEIAMVSVGPDRKQTLQRSGSRLEGWLASRD